MRYCFCFCLSLVITLSFAQGDENRRRPKIIGQRPVSIDEDATYTIQLTDLEVRDRDNWFYPWGFDLTVYPGDHYTLDNHTVIPAANFNGTLSVKVSVNDGQHESDRFKFRIEVRPVNDPPVITGQNSIATNEDESFTIQVGNLIINDPDDSGFSLTVSAGNNYSLNGNTLTPAANFNGTLSIPVQISDGDAASALFQLQLTVRPVNDAPVITAQSPLETDENKPITLQLSHITVADPDNTYPNGFTLTILPSPDNTYTASGTQLYPKQNFEGTLTVPVMVNDGTSNSDPYPLKVTVNPVSYPPVITGQQPLVILEDKFITLQLSHLVVTDQDNNYPSDFSLKILPGENYNVANNIVTPRANFNGALSVNVVVHDGTSDSNTFGLRISVTPVNDVPEIINFESEALSYKSGEGEVSITSTLEVNDADGDSLTQAEISFKPETYRLGIDELIYKNSNSNITGSYQRESATLTLTGKASVKDYTEAIRSVKYNFLAGADLPFETKTVIITVRDNESTSEQAERIITGENVIINLDIPTAFTPNGDQSNDTWSIKPLKQSEEIAEAIVRIYNKKGKLLFEAQGFDSEWDGRLNGELLPADTYFYTIDLNLSSTRTLYKGLVTILR